MTAGFAGWTVRLVTQEPADEIVGSYGLRLRPDGQLSDKPDLLVVPGGGWQKRSSAGAWAEAQRGVLPAAIARLHAAGTIIASVCSGAMLLASTGLLRGRSATTHAGVVADLRGAGADIVSARVVDDGDIITAGGVTSGLDLAIWIVERFFKKAAAVEVARMLEYQPSESVWLRTDDGESTKM
jgi:transcriptional regulator GlxA family with amidase domain